MQSYKIMPIELCNLNVDNSFLGAKFKSSLLENQITALALTRIQQNNKDSDNPLLTAEIYPSELNRILKSSSNIYRTLKTVALSLSNKNIVVEDRAGNFLVLPIIQKAKYDNGVFSITFNSEIKQFILDLKNNFTPLKVSVLTTVSTNGAFRFYEILKPEMFATNINFHKDLGCAIVEYNINELKFLLGICDIDNPYIKNERARMGKHIDYDILFEKLPPNEKKYVQSSDFIRKVVIPAQKELKENADIYFEYEGLKTKGKKVGRIRFFVYNNTNNQKVIEDKARVILETARAREEFNNNNQREYRQLEFPMDTNIELYEDFIGLHGITKTDIDVMLQKAGYSERIVRDAIAYVNRQENVHDFVRYVISVIEHPEWNLELGTAIVSGQELNNETREMFYEAANQCLIEKNRTKNVEQFWNDIKARPDLNEFLSKLDLSLDTFEELYSCQERIDFWKSWLKNKYE